MKRGYSRLDSHDGAEAPASQATAQQGCPTWVRAVSILLLAVIVACALIIPIVLLFSGTGTLANQMSSSRLRVHLTRLEAISNAAGSRAAWTGYNASVAYVEKEIRDNTNLLLSRHRFSFVAYETTGLASISQVIPIYFFFFLSMLLFMVFCLRLELFVLYFPFLYLCFAFAFGLWFFCFV